MGQLGHIALTFAAASNLSYAALLWLSFFGLSENNEAHQAMLDIASVISPWARDDESARKQAEALVQLFLVMRKP